MQLQIQPYNSIILHVHLFLSSLIHFRKESLFIPVISHLIPTTKQYKCAIVRVPTVN